MAITLTGPQKLAVALVPGYAEYVGEQARNGLNMTTDMGRRVAIRVAVVDTFWPRNAYLLSTAAAMRGIIGATRIDVFGGWMERISFGASLVLVGASIGSGVVLKGRVERLLQVLSQPQDQVVLAHEDVLDINGAA